MKSFFKKLKIMNKCKFLFFVLMSLSIISCNKGDDLSDKDLIGGGDKLFSQLTAPEYLSIAFDGDNEIANEEASEILKEFVVSNSQTRSSIASDMVFEVNQEYYLDLCSNNTLTTRSSDVGSKLKVVEFRIKSGLNRSESEENSEGFALVVADKRYPNVLSYVEKGSIDKATECGADIMIARAENIAVYYVSKIEEYQDSLRDSTIDKICKLHKIDNYSFEEVKNKLIVETIDYSAIEDYDHASTRGPGYVNPPGTPIATIGPLVEVEWIQGGPQNQFVKKFEGNDSVYWDPYIYGGRYPAGCTAVAVAQAISYYRPVIFSTDLKRNVNWSTALSSKKIDWRTLPTLPYVIESAAILQEVAKGIKTIYSSAGGSANMDNGRSYISTLGLSIDAKTACNYFTIRPSISALQPVILTGKSRIVSRADYISGSHAWVMDGIKIINRASLARQELQQYNNYGHCNFGWAFGSYNGWYLFDSVGTINFDCGNEKYDIDLSAYPNIKRK